jgi:hypothetical protein
MNPALREVLEMIGAALCGAALACAVFYNLW